MAELVQYMVAHPERFDLIVSVDTLVYFGELNGVLAAAAACLRPAGALVFTVESLSESSQPFVLNPHGRYAHSRRYVESAIEQAGLALRGLEPVTLRSENQCPVKGLLATAVRPADTRNAT